MPTRIQHRIARLERLAPPLPPAEDLRRKRFGKVLNRWMRLCRAAGPLLTPEEDQCVGQALERLANELEGPFAVWMCDLRDGRCRLPELTPAAMRSLLVAWLSPEVDGGMVCNGCGLEYPRHKAPPMGQWKLLPGKKPQEGPPPWYDLPEFFPLCPHCSASRFDVDWPHLVDQHTHAWRELDGYVGA
jgi:hypothetical protein